MLLQVCIRISLKETRSTTRYFFDMSSELLPVVRLETAARSSSCQLRCSTTATHTIAINLKTRLFSICIGTAGDATLRDAGGISFTCPPGRAGQSAHLQPASRPAGYPDHPHVDAGHSGFVSRPCPPLWFNKIRRYCSYCTSNLISARHFALSGRPCMCMRLGRSPALGIRSFSIR